MLLIAALLVSVATVPLAGGRLSALVTARFRRLPMLLGAVAGQVVILGIVQDSAPPSLLAVAHVATYALAGWWVIANRRVPGLAFIGLGGALNALAIVANEGVMPASSSALATAGMPVTVNHFTNSGAVETPQLAFLGDVFAVPSGFPLACVFSVGDVVIALGAAYGLHVICRSRAGAAVAGRLATVARG